MWLNKMTYNLTVGIYMAMASAPAHTKRLVLPVIG